METRRQTNKGGKKGGLMKKRITGSLMDRCQHK